MRTKQIRPEKMEYEFELHISRELDRTKECEFISFRFITTKIFRSFIYKINVTPRIDIGKKHLEFLIEGLSAPVVSIAKSGNAVYDYKLYDFKNGEYELKLLKLDVEKNIFRLKISKSNIKIIKQPTKKFLKVEA
jgi:hypothetical protein